MVLNQPDAMRKSYAIIVAMTMIIVGCTQDNGATSPTEETPLVQVTVSLKGLDISQQDMDDVRSTASEAVRYVAFAVFDSRGSKVVDLTQHIDDEQFGTLSFSLAVGDYTLVAVGHAGNDSYGGASILSASQVCLPQPSFRETFSLTHDLVLPSVSDTALVLTLPRVSSALVIQPTEPQPAAVTQLRIILGNPEATVPTTITFDPSTGLVPAYTGQTCYSYTRNVIVYQGQTYPYTFDLLLPAAETWLPLTVQALDAEGGVLFSRYVSDVPFAQNRQTIATGDIFSQPSSASSAILSFDTQWQTPNTLNF